MNMKQVFVIMFSCAVPSTALQTHTQSQVSLRSATEPTYTIQQKATDFFLDAWEDALNDYGAALRLAQDNDSQEWVITRVGELPDPDAEGALYTIQQKATMRYLDAYPTASKDYRVATRDPQGDSTQTWIITPIGPDGQYTIQQQSNDRYVDAYTTKTYDYAAVTRESFQQDGTRTWVITPPLPVIIPPTPVATPSPPLLDNSTTAGCTSSTTGTCAVYEDPHIQVFDGTQISLLDSSTFASGNGESGVKWLVKSSHVHIQARYMADDTLADPNLFVNAIAVGGPFLQGKILVIGSLEDQITFDGASILKDQTSTFEWKEGEQTFMKAHRGASSLVEDLSKENLGVNVEFPRGVSLVANRLHNKVNVAIKMCPQEGGQEGQCGNYNGVASDDTMEFISSRQDPSVPPEESLF